MAAVLAAAVSAAVLLRPGRRSVHWLFAGFGGSVALWYATAFLRRVVAEDPWDRVNLVCAVLLPIAGVRFFRAFIDSRGRRWVLLGRLAALTAVLLVVAIASPWHQHRALGVAVFVYVLGMLTASLGLVFARARAERSRFEQARLRYLGLVGALAATFTLADYLPYVGLEIPPVGTLLTLVFLYILSQSILRYRLIDLYELAGRLTVLTALSFTIAGIFYFLVGLAAGNFFFHSVIAALVLLLLFDPLRARVEQQIAGVFFRERYDLERTVRQLRGQLAHVFEVDDVARTILEGLERSRRVTHAAVYLVDENLHGYTLAGHLGPAPVPRIETAAARPLLDRLSRERALDRDALARHLEERREAGAERDVETLVEVIDTMDAMHASVCVSIQGERDGDAASADYGFICARDERLPDAFAPEDVTLLTSVGSQAAIALENSRLYQRLRARDRLATLGEMAAGLAHEIRNPLGAIKAAAQFLEDGDGEGEPRESDAGEREFLAIIVEEVDRLDRVVSSFLDYAKPSRGVPLPTDVNTAVERTMRLLQPRCQEAGVEATSHLDPEIPRVRIDGELFRQVLLNLMQNAIQAMESGGGELVVETEHRPARRTDVDPLVELEAAGDRPWVEVRVRDTGPGIPKRVLANLFVPFVTTKDDGTGLGLAISHRIVHAVGGAIEVRSQAGVGTTFVVRLPAGDPRPASEPAPLARPPQSPAEAPLEAPRGAGERASVSDTSR